MRGTLHVRKQQSTSHANTAALTLALLLALSMLLLTGCRAGRSGPEAIDQTTPEAAARSFYQAISDQDAGLLKAVIDEDDEGAILLLSGLERLIAAEGFLRITDIECDLTENDGHRATLLVHFHQTLKWGDSILLDGRGGEVLTLVSKDGRWYVKPPPWLSSLNAS